MEFYSRKFGEAVRMVLESNKIVIVILFKRFVKKCKDKGQIYYLTRENFDEIYNQVLSQIR